MKEASWKAWKQHWTGGHLGPGVWSYLCPHKILFSKSEKFPGVSPGHGGSHHPEQLLSKCGSGMGTLSVTWELILSGCKFSGPLLALRSKDSGAGQSTETLCFPSSQVTWCTITCWDGGVSTVQEGRRAGQRQFRELPEWCWFSCSALSLLILIQLLKLYEWKDDGEWQGGESGEVTDAEGKGLRWNFGNP